MSVCVLDASVYIPNILDVSWYRDYRDLEQEIYVHVWNEPMVDNPSISSHRLSNLSSDD